MPWLSAQTQAEFEVASVKRADPRLREAPGMKLLSSRLEMRSATVKTLVAWAYGIPEDRVKAGPAWLGSDAFDIVAKIAEGARKTADVQQMLQSLLQERFQFAFHRDEETMPVYVLSVAKNGVRIEESSTPERLGMSGSGRGRISGTAQRISFLARSLERMLGRPVLDRTGLTGLYDYKLLFEPFDPEVTPDHEEREPLFAAIREQLGLDLRRGREKVPVVVVDRAERPTEN